MYPAGSYVLLSDNSVGKVIRQNKEFPNRPVIRIMKDENGNDVKEEVTINLVKINHLFIEKVLA